MGAIKMAEVTRNDFIESIHYEKTISIRVSVLKNYCPIFYGSSWDWVGTEDLLENFKVDFNLKSYKKCVNT